MLHLTYVTQHNTKPVLEQMLCPAISCLQSVFLNTKDIRPPSFPQAFMVLGACLACVCARPQAPEPWEQALANGKLGLSNK